MPDGLTRPAPSQTAECLTHSPRFGMARVMLRGQTFGRGGARPRRMISLILSRRLERSPNSAWQTNRLSPRTNSDDQLG